MLQRQIMFKQLEELQRQKKLQELNDSRQQNVINQQSLLHNKQNPGAQYAPLINGTPVRDASQMFMFGNTNMVQGFQNGLNYSQQGQNQVLHSMGLGSQVVDGHNLSRFSHFQGATRETSGEQVQTTSMSSMIDQFNVSSQDSNIMGVQTGNDQQDCTGLDPLEQKFLFNTDDDSLGGFGNMFEDTDNSQAFPSIQSGSWSALMQSALEETSSTDTGVQEEWSGLSFQNPEHSNDNQQSKLMIENGKIPTLWQNNTFPNSTPDASAQIQKNSSLPIHQGHAGKIESVNDALNNGREFKKGLLSDNQIHSKASDETTFRSSDSSGMSAIVDRSGSFPVLDSNAQMSPHMREILHKVDKFREYKQGAQSAYIDSAPTNEMPKAETADAFTPLNNSSAPHNFGLRFPPPTRSSPMNYFGLSQISQQTDTSHVVPLKEQDGQRSLIFEGQQVSDSTGQPNVWVDIQSQQNLSGAGFYKAPSGSPSTSDVANSLMETASETPKASDSQMYAKGHVLNSQVFDYTRGQEGKTAFGEESYSGRAEASASSSSLVHGSGNQAHIFPHGYSPLNPTYSDPSIRATLKNEKVDSDIKVPPQLTSMSQLSSVYENYKNLLVSSAPREDQLVKNQYHLPLQDASQAYRNSSLQMNVANTSQYGSVMPVTGTNSFAINQLFSRYSQHLDVPNQNLPASRSKKRKFPTFELLPWHTEATKGSSRLHNTSIAELEWAQAANRVPEKLNEEGQALGDSPWTVHPKKRIIFTTKLMQVLFRPAPASILKDNDDSSAYINSVTYFAARLALGDACSLANHSHKPCDKSDSPSEKDVISKGSGDQNLSKMVEDFIDRAKKLEDNLLRLENGGSILEIRMEAQDLERFSVINRFAKFHTRAQMAANETTSSGGASSIPKLHPQRYVTANPMPAIVPQGHACLSL